MYYLSICGIVKDEPYLEEWVEYHRIVGVEKFYLYDNESKIPVTQSLARQVQEGFVEVTAISGMRQQFNAYNDCLRVHAADSFWMAMVDADEFLVPKILDDARTLLTDYERFGGLAINWLIFGSSGYVLKPDGLQIESYIKRSPNSYPGNDHVKVIVQSRHTIRVGNDPHTFLYYPDWHSVNEDFKPVVGPFSPNSTNKIQLNHYHLRSLQDYKEKIRRGRADTGTDRGIEYFHEMDKYLNDATDYAILRFSTRLKKALRTKGEK